MVLPPFWRLWSWPNSAEIGPGVRKTLRPTHRKQGRNRHLTSPASAVRKRPVFRTLCLFYRPPEGNASDAAWDNPTDKAVVGAWAAPARSSHSPSQYTLRDGGPQSLWEIESVTMRLKATPSKLNPTITRWCPAHALAQLPLVAATAPKSVSGISRSTKDERSLLEDGTTAPRR